MKEIRTVAAWIHPVEVIEGAGVRLKRCFANNEIPRFDPFLLLDNFHSANPDDYRTGFPWHPHRGIETITYMLTGSVEHDDSLKNRGIINGGDLQWMTAGEGILHQEMPVAPRGTDLWGLQLWVNLPRSHKMTAPRYQEITGADIPLLSYSEGVEIRLISGTIGTTKGPASDLFVDIMYYDIMIKEGRSLELPVDERYNAFTFILEGSIVIGGEECRSETGAHLSKGSHFTASAHHDCRFLLIGGIPLHEPIAWGGPIVMNSDEELLHAFEELKNNTFIKDKK